MTKQLATLKPGQKVTISDVDGVKTIVERSSNGRIGRMVEITANGFVVVRTVDTSAWKN